MTFSADALVAKHARIRAMHERYPALHPRLETGKAPLSKNARVLLKAAFPDTLFSVRLERGGSLLLLVEWVQWPEVAPLDRRAVEGVLQVFKEGAYSSVSDDYVSDDDRERRAFREAFGGVRSIWAQSRPPTVQEIAKRAAKGLTRAMDAPLSKAVRRPRL